MRTRTACGTVQYDLPHGGLLISRVGALQLPSGTIVSGQVPAPPLLCDTLSATMSRALGVLLLRLCAAETKNEEPEFAQHKKVAVAMWSDRVDESNAVVRANKLYARRHGYSFLLDRHRQFPAWTPHWERIPLIASLLQTHSIVAWLDDDAFVEQQHVLVESWFEEQDLVIAQHHSVANTAPDYINTGVMLIRSSIWSRSFFSTMMTRCKAAGFSAQSQCCWDQDCVKWLLTEADDWRHVLKVSSGVFNCHPSHVNYKGDCRPWALHGMGSEANKKATVERAMLQLRDADEDEEVLFAVNAIDPSGHEIEFQFFRGVHAAPVAAVAAACAKHGKAYALTDCIRTVLPFVQSHFEGPVIIQTQAVWSGKLSDDSEPNANCSFDRKKQETLDDGGYSDDKHVGGSVETSTEHPRANSTECQRLSQLLDQLAAARTGRFVGGAARNNLDIKAWSSGMWGTVAVPDHLLSQFFRNISRERSVPFPKSRSVPIHVCATKCKPGGPMIRSSGKPSGMKIVINATCASTHAHMQTCMHMLVCAIVSFHECMSASMCASIHACSSPGPHVYADSAPLSGIAYCKMDGHAPLLTGKRHYPKFNSSTKVGIHARAHT